MQDLQAEAGVDLFDLQILAHLVAHQQQILAVGALSCRDHQNAFGRHHTTGGLLEVNQVGVVGIADIEGGDAAAGATLEPYEGIAAATERCHGEVFRFRTLVIGTGIVIDACCNRGTVNKIAAVPHHIAKSVDDGDRASAVCEFLLIARGAGVVVPQILDRFESGIRCNAAHAGALFVVVGGAICGRYPTAGEGGSIWAYTAIPLVGDDGEGLAGSVDAFGLVGDNAIRHPKAINILIFQQLDTAVSVVGVQERGRKAD